MYGIIVSMKTCTFLNCQNPSDSHGLCSGHNKQRYKGKELTPLRQRIKICTFQGCSKLHDGHGLCMGHNRQRRQGKELSPLRPYIKNDGSVPEGQQLCRSCLIVKPQDEFHRHKGAFNGRALHCKNCARIKDKIRTFRLSLEDLVVILKEQNNQCAVCETPLGKKFAIDHCHFTGEVRGILCSLCNSGIGLLRDNPDICERASIYLRRFKNA